MSLFLLEDPSRNGPISYKRSTRNSAASANPNSTSPASHCRQRTDTLPSRVRKNSLDTALSEAWKLLKLQRCSICLETLDSSHWIRPSTLCIHEPKACEPCLVKYLAHAITDGLSKILCPEVECRKELNYSDIEIRMCGNEESLTRYNALVAQKELEQHPNFVWCTNAQCGKGQIHYEGAISPLVICYHCHAYACFIHRVPWHNNLTCEQYSKHEEANKASEEHIDMHMKRCPNIGCKRPIEKIDGCDHMTCRRPGGCGYEFCWICLADYGPIRIEGNHKHNTDCRHFADQSQRHDNPDAPPTVRRTRRRVCRGRVPVAAAPAINAEDEPFVGRRPDTPIPPESTSSPSPTSPSPIHMPPFNLLFDIYALSPPAFPHSIQPSFPRHFYGVLPESTSSSLGPRVVLSAEASGSGYVHTDPSELPVIIRSSPSPTAEDNMSSRSPTPIPPLRSLPRTEAPERAHAPHCSSLVQPTGFQRSELYRPPPPRRVIRQESVTIQSNREGALRDGIMGERLLFEQGEEQHLSSIPDFESEILLDFIVRR